MSAEAGRKLDSYLKKNAQQAHRERRLGSARLRRWRGRAVSWMYLAPSLIGVGLFFVAPFGVVIYYSVINNPISAQFVGLENFRRLFKASAFRSAAASRRLLVTVFHVTL